MNHGSSPRLKLSTFFSPDDVLCHTKITDRDTLIRKLLELLALNHGIGNVNKAYKAVLGREAVDSTVLASCLALPHARIDAISQLRIAVATSREGLSFNGVPNVHVVVLVLVPVDQPSVYLQALSTLATICHAKKDIDQVAAFDSAEKVWEFFDRGGIVLPDYVRAGDIMSTQIISLRENETLKKAIDLFIQYSLIDIPVVDKDGDLVGVVTAKELLRVCLPDYILWMDDLSPILHFEPFANVLRNEGITWLTEIMSQDYAVVTESAPAIAVAQEMTKKMTQQAYVLRDKKLVGVVTLPQFLNKVLRD